MNNGKNSDAVVLGWQGHLGVHRMPQFGLSVHLWALFFLSFRFWRNLDFVQYVSSTIVQNITGR